MNNEAAWRRSLVCLGLLLGWIFFWYRDTALAMGNIWARSDTYAHGFFVPLISLWLIWQKRARLAELVPRPGYAAWVLMAGCACLWLLGDLVAVNAATQFALTALVVLAVPAVLGWQVTSALLFPLGFLFFAVPIGDFMMPQLMAWTADFTVLALRASGIPVYREGQNFVIPSGNWSVVEACSGIRYLIASVTVGSLFAYLSYRSTQRRLIFVVVSFLVPVIANWMRAYMIVMLGHYSGNKIATGVDHIIYGWLFFGVVIMVMFMIGARWAEHEPVSAGAAEGHKQDGAMDLPSGAVSLAVSACVVAVIAVVPHAVNQRLRQFQSTVVPIVSPIAPQGGWQLTQPPVVDWTPAFASPSAVTHSEFSDAQGTKVGLYVGYYRQQNYLRKLVSSENVVVANGDLQWARTSGGAQTITYLQQPLVVKSAELHRLTAGPQGTDTRLVVWQIYWLQGRLTSNEWLAKMYGAWDRLLGRGDDGAVVFVYTNKQTPSGTSAESILQSFLAANDSNIDASLRQTLGKQ